MQKEIKIEGMMCIKCANRMKRALEANGNIKVVEVSHEQKHAIVEVGDQVTDDQLSQIVTDTGYECKGIR